MGLSFLTDDSISVPDSPDFTLGTSFAIGVRIKTPFSNAGTDLISQFNAGSPFTGFLFGINSFGGVPGRGKLFCFVSGPTGSEAVNSTGVRIDDDVEHSIAVTYDGINFTFYVDGDVDSTIPSAGHAAGDSNNTLSIGKDSNPTPGRFLDGRLTEVFIANRDLSLAEIKAQHQGRIKGSPHNIAITDRVEYWPLDDGSDGTSADGSTVRGVWNGNDGTGDDGANNTGLTWKAEDLFSCPSDVLPAYFTPLAVVSQLTLLHKIRPGIQEGLRLGL